MSVSGERGKAADSVQMDMDMDTDSSPVIITAGTSLELGEKDGKKLKINRKEKQNIGIVFFTESINL